MADNFFDDGNHALLVGMVVGSLLKIKSPDFEVETAVDEDGDLLPYVYVVRPSGRWKISIDPA